jgi:2-phospho-L-lactate/phosphoenolpyruvate guanylyltransferase
MNLWLIVPVKPLVQGKSRLSSLLSPSERAQLNRVLLEQTLKVAISVNILAGVVVISRDPVVQQFANEQGVMVLAEETITGETITGETVTGDGVDPDALLNRALSQARHAATRQSADAILVLPVDLPLLTAAEIRSFYEAGRRLGRGMVITASEDGGTNGLFLCPPHAIEFAYGPQSFQRHVHAAQEAALPIEIIHSPALALDLDLPQDLLRWREMVRREDEETRMRRCADAQMRGESS